MNDNKCLKCDKTAKSTGNSLECSQCQNFIQLKCSRLTKIQFNQYKKGKMRFVCQFCTDYSCLKCNKHAYYRQKGVLCTGCNLWIHQKCANLTNNEYKEFQNEIWYGRNCKADMLPFFNLTNNQFPNFLNINIYVSNHQVDENRFTNPINSLPCSVCYKKNKKTNSLKCNTCKPLFHKKMHKFKN